MFSALSVNTCLFCQLNSRIKQLEEASLSEKSWQLTGEITGPARPENSLLEEHLQFDVNARAGGICVIF